MASDAKKLQPIIVKKVKKAGHAVHGGAWKIAYADFVTAMMAFFLLMWLLGSTSTGDLKGLSDYFASPLKVAMTGGTGAGASPTVLPGGGADLTQQVGQQHKGESADPLKKRRAQELARAEAAQQDAKRLAALSAKISAAISNNKKLAQYSNQIRLETTPDGLQIQIVDEQGRPMFTSGSAMVQPYMREILREIGTALGGVENRISLDGHTDQTAFTGGLQGYSNWELSADRANASRRELVLAGMPEDKLIRVTGLASSVLLEPDQPQSPVNRRISIMVLTREAEERLLGTSRVPVLAEPEAAAPPTEAPAAPGAAPAPVRQAQ
ncbi:flagellar motor protein MotB [Methyloversatilis sp.]|uniref:flagellar motor protein MotB n=1 Tax=Methyloversatilis sp. TaxID=2569862 RepID=UPI0027344303|nr:flagellar motor protein MotB [Methyloversatilis sp.]MDP3577802.1 flagellar motor protein MotB [Methyloversatilis sp.]